MCTTPVQVTSSQLIASEVFPLPVVKGLLYPGAILNGLVTDMTVPSWNNLLSIYNLTEIKEASAAIDLQRLETMCRGFPMINFTTHSHCLISFHFFVRFPDWYLKPGRMSMFGTLLVIWGLVKEGILAKPANTDPTTAVFVYPTMLIALVCAFLSVKYDMKKVVKTARLNCCQASQGLYKI
ncbi:UNVERIFIED_CONTAM: hypothetical protein Sradi_6768900 [Sesamum radiatum]|uniref:Uncharacterized protein n=1 Tax=Sesamum radiatum TaxID=300843 RepID=A0AAW2JSS3_SESRA